MFFKDYTDIMPEANPIRINAHKGPCYVIKFSQSGEHLISGGADKVINIWNPFKGLLIKSLTNIHSQEILDLVITNDNNKVLTSGMEKVIYYSDLVKGNVIRRFQSHLERVNTITMNSLESVIISGSYDCSVRMFDLKSQNRDPIQVLSGAKDSITKVVALKEKIISSSLDKGLRVYDIRMGQMQLDYINSPILSFDLSPDEKYFILSGKDSSVRLMENATGDILKSYTGGHDNSNYSNRVMYNSSDYSSFFVTSEDSKLVNYNIVSGESNKDAFEMLNTGISKCVSGLDVSPIDKSIIACSCHEGNIYIYNSKF